MQRNGKIVFHGFELAFVNVHVAPSTLHTLRVANHSAPKHPHAGAGVLRRAVLARLAARAQEYAAPPISECWRVGQVPVA